MNREENKIIKIALLDLYDGYANQGMRCIRQLVSDFAKTNDAIIQLDEFDVRQHLQAPDISYDAFISSGGPGSPLDSFDKEWEKKYFEWLSSVELWNNEPINIRKKHIFFICHSFQMACRYFNAGLVSKRKSTSFGVFPVHMLEDSIDETVFTGLKDPFFAVDSRDYQVTQPNMEQLNLMGGSVLSIEKERPHVPYERAVMAMRFNPYFLGTQFHPEADAKGMRKHLETDEKKLSVIEEHGYEKWESMVEHLQDPDKIVHTYNHIIPNFLKLVVESKYDNKLM